MLLVNVIQHCSDVKKPQTHLLMVFIVITNISDYIYLSTMEWDVCLVFLAKELLFLYVFDKNINSKWSKTLILL